MAERRPNHIPLIGPRITRTSAHADAIGFKPKHPGEQFRQFVTGGEFGFNQILSQVIPNTILATKELLHHVTRENIVPIVQLTWKLIATMEPILREEFNGEVFLMSKTKELLDGINKKIADKTEEVKPLMRDKEMINNVTRNIDLLLAKANPVYNIPDPQSFSLDQGLENKVRDRIALISLIIERVKQDNASHRRFLIQLEYDRDTLVQYASAAWGKNK